MGIRARLDALDRRFDRPVFRSNGPNPVQSALIKRPWLIYAAVFAFLVGVSGLAGALAVGRTGSFLWSGAGATFVVLLVLGLWQTRRLRSKYQPWDGPGVGVGELARPVRDGDTPVD